MQRHLAHLNSSLDGATGIPAAPISPVNVSQHQFSTHVQTLSMNSQPTPLMVPQVLVNPQPSHPQSTAVTTLAPTAQNTYDFANSLYDQNPSKSLSESAPGGQFYTNFGGEGGPRQLPHDISHSYSVSHPHQLNHRRDSVERSVSASTVADWPSSNAVSRTGSAGVSIGPRSAAPPAPMSHTSPAPFLMKGGGAEMGNMGTSVRSDYAVLSAPTENGPVHTAQGSIGANVPIAKPPVDTQQWSIVEAQQRQLQRQEAMMTMLLEQQAAIQRQLQQQQATESVLPTAKHPIANNDGVIPDSSASRASSIASTYSTTSETSYTPSEIATAPTAPQSHRFRYNGTNDVSVAGAGFASISGDASSYPRSLDNGVGSRTEPTVRAQSAEVDQYKGMSLEEMQEALRLRMMGAQQARSEPSIAANNIPFLKVPQAVRESISPSPTPTRATKSSRSLTPTKVAQKIKPVSPAVEKQKDHIKSRSAPQRVSKPTAIIEPQAPPPLEAAAPSTGNRSPAVDEPKHEVPMTGAEVFAVLRLRGLIVSSGDTGERHLPPSRCHTMKLTSSELSQLQELREALAVMQQQYLVGSEEVDDGHKDTNSQTKTGRGVTGPSRSSSSASISTLSRWKI